MSAFAFHPARVAEPTAVLARDKVVGAISFLPDTREWLAEADGHRRYCPSYPAALSFIETVHGSNVRPPSVA